MRGARVDHYSSVRPLRVIKTPGITGRRGLVAWRPVRRQMVTIRSS